MGSGPEPGFQEALAHRAPPIQPREPAEGELPPPGNLTVMALNTWYTMSWDWDQSSAPAGNVTFTAQYVAKYRLKMRRRNPSWVTVCGDSPDSSCELTGCSLHYLGIYMLRVRASAGGRDSAWVHREFCPDKDGDWGPKGTGTLEDWDPGGLGPWSNGVQRGLYNWGPKGTGALRRLGLWRTGALDDWGPERTGV
ncbi:unnamed protein product [Menidia menidia]|uniref:(Atlantic silverside) hypothetical protein n=1 Tax=Menidia menidia TaxID=238744 RepID=A0A8S4AD01_9TELE|nr:unnamed protein product [Menidia menidia]